MSKLMNFEPFIDFDSVTPEMASDLWEAVRESKRLQDVFADHETPDSTMAGQWLEASEKLDRIYSAAMQTLYTVPMVIHVAGPKKEETNPDNPDQTGVLQRCSRCGSVLNFWHDHILAVRPTQGVYRLEEGDVPWWKEGAIVAKSSATEEMNMYEVSPGRELEKHERECADLSGLIGETS